MKRTISILILVISILLAGCGETSQPTQPAQNTLPEESKQTTPAADEAILQLIAEAYGQPIENFSSLQTDECTNSRNISVDGVAYSFYSKYAPTTDEEYYITVSAYKEEILQEVSEKFNAPIENFSLRKDDDHQYIIFANVNDIYYRVYCTDAESDIPAPEYSLDKVLVLDDKPVIYLYPEKEEDVTVKLLLQDGQFTTIYPQFNIENGWTITAHPDGILVDENGMEYNYLYWEGINNHKIDTSKGYCIKGEDTAKFLEEKLAQLGLTRKEANEFIVYWLPQMESNSYNYISFETDDYINKTKLDVNPVPDIVIRVFMSWMPLNEYIQLEQPEEIETPVRNGFTVVEWGGTQIGSDRE